MQILHTFWCFSDIKILLVRLIGFNDEQFRQHKAVRFSIDWDHKSHIVVVESNSTIHIIAALLVGRENWVIGAGY